MTRPGGTQGGFSWPQDPFYRPGQGAAEPAGERTVPMPAPGPAGAADPVVPPAAGYPGRAAFDLGTATATVAVWDPQRSDFPSLSPAQRRTLADGLAELLDADPPGPQELVVHWKEFRTELAEVLAAAGGAGVSAVSASAAEQLRRPAGTGELLHRAVAELERLRVNRGPVMSRFLTPRLARCYEQALQLPPLDSLRLFKAYLEGDVAQELPSVVWDAGPDTDPRFTLARPEGGETAVAYRGLKQQLGRSAPRVAARHGAPTFPELMTGALDDLRRRTDKFLDQFRGRLGLSPGRLTDVVVTYPTMAPLAVRDTLAAMLRRSGVLHVDTRFDEAVAAAMFYVLREVGGRTDLAVEAFSARCEPVPGANLTASGRPTAWRQNVLIVDVGGGTTDVALLEIVLQDETDRTVPGGESPHYGRYFRLRPTLLGTTGESQRGGDYLTLQVFRLLKVLLADHLLTTVPAVADAVRDRADRYTDREGRYLPGRLVEVGLVGLTELREAAEVAGHVVPTEWRDSTPGRAGGVAEREELFTKLWRIAEAAKRDLGAEPVVTIDEVDLRGLRDDVLDMHRQTADGDVPRVELRQEDFVRLVREPVGHVMDLAADLARVRLADLPRRRGLPEQALHKVVLTGRGSLLPLVRTELVRALDSRFGGKDGEVRRVPPVVGYGDDFAKHAASIGACWAATVDRRRQEDVLPRLAEGVTWLTVDVDNLFRSMRAAFVVPGPLGSGPAAATPLFGMDAELRMTASHPEPVVRSEWLPYQNPVLVDRVQGDETTVNWAHLRLQEYLQENPAPGFELTREREEQLFVQVEAAASLDVWAWLCSGRSPLVDLGSGATSRDLRPRLGEPAGEGAYPSVPATVEVDRAIGGFLDDGATDEPVFRAGDPFDRVVEVRGERRRARVSEPLPVPHGGSWTFGCHAAGADAHPATTQEPDILLAPPIGPGLRHHAVLDDHGELHVVAGEPAYRRAADLAELFEKEGTALRVPMTSGEPDYDPLDDPFTGLQ